jgi:hypothetical protein
MAIPSLQDILRWMQGGSKKEKSVFATEQEAYEFCQKVYNESGGVPPDLRRAYEFYLKNYHDDCPPGARHPTG